MQSRVRAHRGASVNWPLVPLIGACCAVWGCAKERPFADGFPETAAPESSGGSGGSLDGAGEPTRTDVTPGPSTEGSSAEQPGLGGRETANDMQSSGMCGTDAGCLSLPPSDAGIDASCPGCLIEGVCVASGEVNSANTCQTCDPNRSALAWSPNDGPPCDDAQFCTVDDACAGGLCAGTARECDDGVSCNGTSTCDELTDSCSAPVSTCPAGTACDDASDTCVSTCNGCLINGVCVTAGAEAAGNPCLVCTPAASASSFSPAVGKACGAAAAECSGQDTCDALGSCQPNHSPANSPCGSAATSACDQPDSCDGNGNCLQRVAANGSPCDDGAFCTAGDQCLGGQCLPTGTRNCGANRSCNEGTDQCVCDGCAIGESCVSAGTLQQNDICQICDPSRSAVGFSSNTNASCGAGMVCNAQSQCVALQPIGTVCSAATQCSSGFCRLWFRDVDGDAHGDPALGTMLCSVSPLQDQLASQASARVLPIMDDINGDAFAGVGDDCCDSPNGGGGIFPGHTNFRTAPQESDCPNVDPFDINCSGQLEDSFDQFGPREDCGADCRGGFWVEPRPACGTTGLATSCVITDGICGLSAPSTGLRACQ